MLLPNEIPPDQLLNAIIDSSDDAIVSKTLEGIVTSWNKSAEQIFGYSAEEMIGQSIVRLFPSDRTDEEGVLLSKIKRGERVDHFETIRRKKSGELIDVSVTLSPIKNNKGVIVGASKIARDVTHQKNAERAASLLRAIIDSSDDAIVSKTLEGKITSWNNAAQRIFGYSASEAIGESISILFPEDRLQEEPVILERIKRGERVEHFETLRLAKDGRPVEVSVTISPIKDHLGQVVGASKIARDISDQKKALQKSSLLAALVDSSDDAIISKDLNGIVTSWNKGAEKLFGYPATEMIGKPITLLFPADRLQEEAEIMGHIRSGERIEHFETIRVAKNGRHIPISLTFSPILDSRGKVSGASKIARDISEQRKAQETLKLANERLKEVDKLKSEFLATMSHELRTPLNSIIGFTGIVQQEYVGPLNAEQKKQLGMVYNSARHLLSLITDLLDLSRIESGKMQVYSESFDPSLVVDEVEKTLSPLVAQRNLTFSTDLDLPPRIKNDRKKLYQVLLNLANNAVKFTHAGGVKIIGRTSEDQITISVEDTGIGIKPEQMGTLFQAFRQAEGAATRKYEGTGLGLYLSKKLVSLMGGDIRGTSEYGKGSCFTVTIPLSAPSQSEV